MPAFSLTPLSLEIFRIFPNSFVINGKKIIAGLLSKLEKKLLRSLENRNKSTRNTITARICRKYHNNAMLIHSIFFSIRIERR